MEGINIFVVNGMHLCLMPSYDPTKLSCENQSLITKKKKLAAVPIQLVRNFLRYSVIISSINQSGAELNNRDIGRHIKWNVNDDENNNDIEKNHLIEELEVDMSNDVVESIYIRNDKIKEGTNAISSKVAVEVLVDNDQDGLMLMEEQKKIYLSKKNYVQYHDQQNFGIVEIYNSSGFIIADFFSNAFDQILFLPKISLPNSNHESKCFIDSVFFQKKLLHTILSLSVLTDGTDILYNETYCTFGKDRTKLQERDIYSSPSLIKTPFVQMCNIKNILGNPTISKNYTKSKAKPIFTDSKNNLKSKYPNYIHKMDKAINHCFSAHFQHLEKQKMAYRLRSQSLLQNRKAVATLIKNYDNININGRRPTMEEKKKKTLVPSEEMKKYMCFDSTPEMIRLRYKIQHSAKLIMNLYLEVDIYLYQPRLNSNDSEQPQHQHHGTKSESDMFSIHNIFLSASIASNTKIDNISAKLKSISGVVPKLQVNQCVTISLSLSLEDNDLMFINASNFITRESFVTIALNAIWNNTNSMSSSSLFFEKIHLKSIIDEKKQGKVLGLLRVPKEKILMNENCWNTVDFTKTTITKERFQLKSQLSSLISCALFEYRHPRTVVFTTKNNSMDTNVFARQLFGTMEYDRIDWNMENNVNICNFGMMSSMVLFAESPERRAAMVQLALKYLPDSVKIVESVNKKMIHFYWMIFLASLENEIELVLEHGRCSQDFITMTTLKEYGKVRCISDEVASIIIGGKSELDRKGYIA